MSDKGLIELTRQTEASAGNKLSVCSWISGLCVCEVSTTVVLTVYNREL